MSEKPYEIGDGEDTAWSWPGLSLLLLVNLLAVDFLLSPGTGDVSIWFTWMNEIASRGVIGAFSHTGTDYPPLCFFILGAVVGVAQTFAVSQFVVLKCALLLCLLASTAAFFAFTRNVLLAAALEASLILSSVGLGYLDIFFAPFLITGLFLLRQHCLNSGFLCYAASCMFKWQPLIIAPFLCLYVLSAARDRSGGRSRATSQAIPFLLSGLLILVPALAMFGGPALFDSFKRALTNHQFLSGYALNLPWIETWALHLIAPEKYGGIAKEGIGLILVHDPLIIWPNKILFYLTYAGILFAFVQQTKTFQRLIIYSLLGYFAYFCFNTGVHENHLFLICCLSWIVVFLQPTEVRRMVTLAIAANANLFVFYGAFGQRADPVFAGFDLTLLFAVFNLWLFAEFLYHTFQKDRVWTRFRRMSESSAATD